MSTVTFVEESTTCLVDHRATDQQVIDAARVSVVGGSDVAPHPAPEKFIDHLIRNRHGSPFEHTSFTFRITAPIFVWREFMRHRIGFSYNEQSSRYSQLEPVFYLPPASRPLVQVGKAAAYHLVDGDWNQEDVVLEQLKHVAIEAYASYETMLGHGIAREVARMCLPVNIVSTAYVTCNARSLMAFLSLRVDGGEASTFPTHPQWEIDQVAQAMEAHFAEAMPATHAAFTANGRVAP